ncbi:SpoIIE family protein phosphatase [Candidatus Soleaferrea massiliensis]|uniref:SpoIIE family protein phosphatase n=1 Tax=Candidatus Soleaferrea massiliensis TaxID=1470354 RepID=UPI00058FC273|nr:SpoIIE family protein phosphatase [Candidatus Soleaferrea massiliensis]
MSLYIETSYDSLFKHGEELCGDKVELVKTDSETILVLSDGLGSGVKANILASLTSKICVTMLAEGASIPDVVETVATTLPVCKERQIAYSTFTILRIKNNGDATLVEYDNPETIFLHDGVLTFLEKEEFEVAGKKIKEAHFKLVPGDICVMFSDGAVHAGVGKLLNFGWQQKHIEDYAQRIWTKDITAHSIQRQMLEACNSLYMEQPGDDTTFAACRICLPSVAHIMVGPPVNGENDEKVVGELMSTSGRKIVCGGTTSQIVSRTIGKPLRVALNYISRDVPPTGLIEGIDLVTEGVITLGKTLEYIKRYENGGVGRENALHAMKDGAAKLAQILIEDCTGAKFLVGRALNPAHQNPDLPINLNLKLRIVEDIASALRGLGKAVTVEYF